MLWEVDIYPAAGQPNRLAETAIAEAADIGLPSSLAIDAAQGYLIQGNLRQAEVERIAAELLSDGVVQRTVISRVGEAGSEPLPHGRGSVLEGGRLIHVLPKPGVTDPVAESALAAIGDFNIRAEAVRTLKKYWVVGLSDAEADLLAAKVLANDAIEQVIVGPLRFAHLAVGSPYRFERVTVPLGELDDEALRRLSRQGQLFLSVEEMRTIQAHFRSLGREPTDVELETLAQTWSEHCSHKTLAGRIHYRDETGETSYENMLKETIFAATEQIRRDAGENDWCVSVFKDNAGVIRFDEQYNVCFKVETHNHPSALEPYGGANTGIGGVIRDPMGTGLGAKPICNTDVFCFAPPDTPADAIPQGVLHPRRVMKGVVYGVRDYGNRMGIPTVNGAVYFDPRYLGNPLVYCGNVGLIPRDKSTKSPRAGDLVVALGGRTGRDGIHGATFSSAELTHQSDELSGGAVQIGNAITEKMLLDVLLVARDRGLYSAVTDCGAGGFSSAVGEMGEHIGAEVWLERVPLKYEGLSYTEIWISEAQERMVVAVPEDRWNELSALCASEGVEATVIGRFVPTGRLVLKYDGHEVADLSMDFLHNGRPPVVREAIYEKYEKRGRNSFSLTTGTVCGKKDSEKELRPLLSRILGSLNVASKHWIIRQYDHEVQGGSVVKPLVGVRDDGPSDAAVLRPVLDSSKGIVIACGMNPRYGDLDTYHMAASAIDEAVRNCVAVGADPSRIAILDNFCWGNTDRPETLGSLVRAARACHDVSIALGTPFISGKDSLNNEFRPEGASEAISIPPSLLISAIGLVDDVARCVTMDLKQPGSLIYLVGLTKNELGGSHFALVEGLDGGCVPTLDPPTAKRTFHAIHAAVDAGLVRSCHDLSEGGLAVAAAEMAFAGGLGVQIALDKAPAADDARDPAVLLFSESNTRFLCEVRPEDAVAFETTLAGVPHAAIGQVTAEPLLRIADNDGAAPLIEAHIDELKEAWRKPLAW